MGFGSWDSWALKHKLSCCGAQAQLLPGIGDLPGPGIKLLSIALAGGFFTTEPPGKSIVSLFLIIIYLLPYNIVLILPYINMNPPQVYTCSPYWTPLPPPSPYHPSGSSQCTSPKLPVSCIEPGLAIHFLYDFIHVLMPFSQIIPPTSPTESKRLFYTSVSLLLSRIQGCRYHLSKFNIYALVYCIGVFLFFF